jgi:hypothetical protein
MRDWEALKDLFDLEQRHSWLEWFSVQAKAVQFKHHGRGYL